jgi:RNA polymerase sigma-70 factor (ECF subfamily)
MGIGARLDSLHAQEVTTSAYLHVWRHSARFDPGRGSALGWIMTTPHQAAWRVSPQPSLRS